MLLDSDDAARSRRRRCARARAARAASTWSTWRGCARRRGASGSPRASTCASRLRRAAADDRARRSATSRARPPARCCWPAGWPPAWAGSRRRSSARADARDLAARVGREDGEVTVALRAGRPGRARARRRHRGLRRAVLSCRCDRGAAAWTRARRRRRRRARAGRSSAPPAGRAESSARASARRCCATRPTVRRSTPRGSSARHERRDRGRRGSRRAPARRCWSAPRPGGGHVVLTGGSTPRAAYRSSSRAVRAVERRPRADARSGSATSAASRPTTSAPTTGWSRAHARPLGRAAPPVHVERMRGELGPERGRRGLRARAAGGRAAADSTCVLLGIGPDGHIASLFPDQPTLSASAPGSWSACPRPGSSRSCRGSRSRCRRSTAARQVVVPGRRRGQGRRGGGGVRPRPARPDPHVPASLLAPLADELTVLLDPRGGGLDSEAGYERRSSASTSAAPRSRSRADRPHVGESQINPTDRSSRER